MGMIYLWIWNPYWWCIAYLSVREAVLQDNARGFHVLAIGIRPASFIPGTSAAGWTTFTRNQPSSWKWNQLKLWLRTKLPRKKYNIDCSPKRVPALVSFSLMIYAYTSHDTSIFCSSAEAQVHRAKPSLEDSNSKCIGLYFLIFWPDCETIAPSHRMRDEQSDFWMKYSWDWRSNLVRSEKFRGWRDEYQGRT